MDLDSLTSEQKTAVTAVGKNVCVSAGAGTGKTHVLVERFVYLIEQKLARPQEILAITFTEKAANEMKSRITIRLRESTLEEARRELENAYIGTIHSFCARLLREHPIEAEVDPAFRVIEEDESNLWKEMVLDQLIEARFSEPDVFEFLRQFGEEQIRDSLKSVSGRCHVLGVAPSAIQNSSAAVDNSLKQKILDALRLLESSKGKEQLCAEIKAILAQPVSDWTEFEHAKQTAKQFRKQGNQKTEIETFRNLFDDWLGIQADELGQKTRGVFLDLLNDFDRRYRDFKRARSGLDFNDLERKAVDLLGSQGPKHEALRILYRSRFRFVMVDEFQDTSLIQNQLLSLLSRADNVFVVGDWKQSIYGFRGAEPELFLEKESEYARSPSGSTVSLVQNFRSRPEVLNSINSFFKTLWAGDGIKLDLLTAGKRPIPKSPSVEFFILSAEDESAEEVRIKEAQALAEHIRDSAASGAYEYRDFAMLFRAGTDIYFYEHELKNRNIPYFVITSRGFYHQPEIRDLISFLEVLDNPHLDIPLAAVLRSPLVQVSDDTLFWLAQGSTRAKPREPLWRALLAFETISEIHPADRALLEAFRTFFAELLNEKEKWTVSECLELILERTRYDRYVLGLREARRRYANLRKLLEIARELENREPVHLGDFVRYVKSLESQEVRESEAQVEALEGNVVKLMTVHKAKGLEFPVVILPDLNRKWSGPNPPFMIDSEWGFGFQVWNEATHEFEETFAFRKAQQKLKRIMQDESKRLLYVAMTRAADHLIFAGASRAEELRPSERENGSVAGTNWYEWLEPWSRRQDSGVTLHHVREIPARKGRLTLPWAERKSIRSVLEQGKTFKIKTADAAKGVIEALQPIAPVPFARIDLPVSAYAVFAHDAEEYRRVYEVGGVSDEKAEEWSEDEEAVSARDFGTILHRVFEHLVLNPDRAKTQLSKFIDRFASEPNQEVQGELEHLSKQFIASEQFATISRARICRPEIPFVLRLSNGIVQGTLDLLYQDERGKWVILDYKTSAINLSHRDDDIKGHAARYEPQMMLYALACDELLKVEVDRARLYFVRAGRHFDFTFRPGEIPALRARFEAMQKEILASRKL